MNASIQSYPAITKPSGLLRVAPVLCRLPLLIVAVVFTLISLRFLLNPVHAAAVAGISFTSPAGITAAKTAFVAFPLSFAMIAFASLLSSRRLLPGLYALFTTVAVGTTIRILSLLTDHSGKESGRLLGPEFVLLVLFVIAIRLESSRAALSS